MARALGVSTTLDELRDAGDGRPAPPTPADSDPAAVVFTSGATGPAKGVSYRHHQLQAQRDALARVYGISADDRFVAAFAPFALYGPAMGVPSVVPDMNVTAPGRCVPSRWPTLPKPSVQRSCSRHPRPWRT